MSRIMKQFSTVHISEARRKWWLFWTKATCVILTLVTQHLSLLVNTDARTLSKTWSATQQGVSELTKQVCPKFVTNVNIIWVIRTCKKQDAVDTLRIN